MIHNYIERLSSLMRNESRLRGGEYGLQPIQLEALHYLSSCNRYSDTVTGVTEFLGQTKGTVSQTLKVLERKGYISRVVDTEDKRVIHMKVTPSGRKLVADIVPPPNFINGIESLDQKTREQIGKSVSLLLSQILRVNGAKTFGVCKSCIHNRALANGKYYCDLVQTPLTTADINLICREHVLAA